MSLRSLAELPGPRALPLVGNALEIRPDTLHQVIERWSHQYGALCRVHLGPRNGILVADPELINAILRDRPERFRRLTALEGIARELGINGLFSAEGAAWSRQRRAWMKALNAHQVRPFFATLTDTTRRLHCRWEQAARRGAPIDVQDDLMRYTVDVTTRFAFGVESNTLEAEGDRIQQYLAQIFQAINDRLAAPVPYWRYLKLPKDRALDRAMAVVKDYVNSIIAEARQRLAADPAREAAPQNLLEALIVARDDDGSAFTDEEILGNTLTALLAGEDTTANTLAWMIHLLCRNPMAQRQLQVRVDAALGNERLWSELQDGDALRCVDAVMIETLRLKPVAPLLFLCACEDVQIGNVAVPAGTDVLCSLRAPTRHEDRYPDAARFLPDRWLGQQKKFATQAPMPFGGGPRMCPGKNLATMEVRSVASMLARNFTVEETGDSRTTERMAFTLVPDGLRVRLIPR
ncbi:MAG: cytochrome P450 [Algiphilus sp.]|uniref:cytochrome P450 n=1 Tax=Algiphilus sp. TaxID=1872431 RepID=UPI0032F09BE5